MAMQPMQFSGDAQVLTVHDGRAIQDGVIGLDASNPRDIGDLQPYDMTAGSIDTIGEDDADDEDSE